MPARSEIAYFGAGPAPLPTPIIEASAASFVNFENTGLSLAEISHRSPTANKILEDAKVALASLYNIPSDDYEILFMQGGGTGEFSAVVQNLVAAWVERRRRRAVEEIADGPEKEAAVLERVRSEVDAELKADYLVTGSWSLKASQEAARLLGAKYVNVAVDARKAPNAGGKFGTIPDEKEWTLSPAQGSAYTYLCDNETVDGVEFPRFPEALAAEQRIVVADMSSNFLSRRIDVKKFGVIFAGAQKNLGIPGITVTIIRKSLLSLTTPPVSFLHSLSATLPTSGSLPPVMFSFATIASNNSLYNTLPIFNLYVATLVLQSLVQKHGSAGLQGQEDIAGEKAHLIYSVLDEHPAVFCVVPDKAVRSRMNICFRIVGADAPAADEAREKAFLSGAESRGLLGLKGHRSVGGIRASNYNAVPPENAKKLAAWLEEFAKQG